MRLALLAVLAYLVAFAVVLHWLGGFAPLARLVYRAIPL